MDKTQSTSIMSKFVNKVKKTKPSNVGKSSKPTPEINSGKPMDEKSGFYETLIIKKTPITEKTIKKDIEICKKIGSINELMKKKYMIPSQFPSITQAHSK